ncbi:MAG: pitrilysin family protein [Planctomycetota bacterium]
MSKVQSSRLDNDIVVLTEEMPQMHGVGISLLVDAGPQDETESERGLAHVCEHALFLGTETRSEQQIAELIDTAGGQLGAFTARDYTCLFASISADYVTYAMDLLGDLLSNSRFSPDRLRNELDVIGHEIDSHEDETEAALDSELKDMLWANDPLGRSILGFRESISQLGTEDVFRFVNRNYTGDRIIVAAAGQIDHDNFVELANDSFWQISGVDQRVDRQPAASRGGVVIRPSSQRSCLVNVMLPTPTYQYPNRYAFHVLTALLGGGMSSRLYRELRERNGLAYAASASWHAYGRGGALAIDVSTTPATAMSCLQKVFGELVELAFEENAITEEELWKAKMQVRGQAFLANDSISTRVGRLTTQQLYFGNTIPTERMLAKIEDVTLDDVAEVAQNVIASGIQHTAVGLGGALPCSVDQLRSEIDALRDCFSPAATDST